MRKGGGDDAVRGGAKKQWATASTFDEVGDAVDAPSGSSAAGDRSACAGRATARVNVGMQQ
jgi:hypothetical protein